MKEIRRGLDYVVAIRVACQGELCHTVDTMESE